MRPLHLRAILFLAMLSLAPIAAANGAMGYALEIFEFRVWAVYVAATVLLEAWIVGRFLGHSWLKSILLSLGINAMTAFCCAGGSFAAFLHSMTVDGNPLWWTTELLVVFGLVSACAESIPWRLSNKSSPKWQTFRRTLLAHLAGVPLALVILLIPARPYPSLEAGANTWRRIHLRWDLRHVYDDRFDDGKGEFKQFQNVKELEHRLDELGGYGVCLYASVYRRFDWRDPRIDPLPVELNQHVSDKEGWLLRIHEPDGLLEVTSGGETKWKYMGHAH